MESTCKQKRILELNKNKVNMKTRLKLNRIKYFLCVVLVAVLFTACDNQDFMVVQKITKDKTGKCNFFIETNSIHFRTNQKLYVGDTLYISKNNCR